MVLTSSVVNTNPAGRLHTILSTAKQAGGSAFEIWARVFQVSVSPELEAHVEVIGRVVQLGQLIEDTEDQLRRIDGLTEAYFRPFPRMRPLIAQSVMYLKNDLTAMLNQITEGDLTVLEFASEKLNEYHVEPVVDEKELEEILQDVTALFDEVKVADIDPEIKTFVLDGLEAIRRGINEFRIRGPERLRETLGEIIGSLAVNRDLVKAAANQEAVGRFEKLCYRFAAVVSFASDATALLGAVKVALLPSGG